MGLDGFDDQWRKATLPSVFLTMIVHIRSDVHNAAHYHSCTYFLSRREEVTIGYSYIRFSLARRRRMDDRLHSLVGVQ